MNLPCPTDVSPGKISLLIAPLVSIEQQCRKVCSNWGISHLSLDETREEDLIDSAMRKKPVVITSTITRVSEEGVQKSLRRLPVSVICVDEAQVFFSVRKAVLHFTLDR